MLASGNGAIRLPFQAAASRRAVPAQPRWASMRQVLVLTVLAMLLPGCSTEGPGAASGQRTTPASNKTQAVADRNIIRVSWTTPDPDNEHSLASTRIQGRVTAFWHARGIQILCLCVTGRFRSPLELGLLPLRYDPVGALSDEHSAIQRIL